MKLYNTLSRLKEEFTPLRSDEVRMYTCGPTVYDYAHIGNFRTFIFEDVLRRYFKLKGYRIVQVMNITDIDDKTIAGARREGVSLDQYTARFIEAFFEDLDAIGIERAEFYPRATAHIDEMVAIISDLLDKGYAYEKDGSVYFDISKFDRYGKLSGREMAEVRGVVEADEYEVEDARDFALWKGRKEGEPSWETPFGEGRPGWHMECSAMSMKYLGSSFDIHTGGVDNIFPHHENEIAQSEPHTGKPFVRYWLHCEHLLVDGRKMSKSEGNYYTLRDLLERGYEPMAIHFLLASSYYRHPLNFTLGGLEGAHSTLIRIGDFHTRVMESAVEGSPGEIRNIVERAGKGFVEGLEDDLNCPKAQAPFFEMIREVNRRLDAGCRVSHEERSEILDLIDRIDRIFGILPREKAILPEKVSRMIREREEARTRKDYPEADRLRKEIEREGFLLEDTQSGVKWKRFRGGSRG